MAGSETPTTPDPTSEPASFRDPDSSVFYADGKVLRGLSERVVPDWERLQSSSFFPALLEQGKVVGTTVAEVDGAGPYLSPRGEPWAQVLEHERVPVVSYA